jgi:hypothetical protein
MKILQQESVNYAQIILHVILAGQVNFTFLKLILALTHVLQDITPVQKCAVNAMTVTALPVTQTEVHVSNVIM